MTKRAALPISRRLLLAGVPSFTLAGCVSLLAPGANPPKLYMLAPPMPPALSGPKVSWALSIQRPDASAGFDTERIAITRAPASLDYYADAAWSDRLPALVQTSLVEAFEASGRMEAVARDSDGAHADYILATDLRDFEARYGAAEGAPTAVVRIGARLLNAQTRGITARLDAEHQTAAARNTVDAAVEALDAALGAVLAQIVTWAFEVTRTK